MNPSNWPPPDWRCDVCESIAWFQLQQEDSRATAHHATRKALEASAKTCVLCQMVLRAAISNHKDSRGVRYGMGYWTQTDAIRHIDHAGTVRDVTYIKNLGACLPERSTDWRDGPGGGRPVIAPTGSFDADFKHVKREDGLPSLEKLDLEDASDDWPVWLYGNWWAVSLPKRKGDISHLRLMGIGARFARSQSHFDAIGLRPGDVNLRGSAIGICTNKESMLSMLIPGRLREMHSDSNTAYSRVEDWIKDCSLNHPLCGRPPLDPPLPRRVIDVSSNEPRVSLFETNGLKGRYIALSHCWGSSSRLMTTSKTMEDFKAGLALSYLPKTFQDAIKITKRLGIKYLWIDCFCIIQDDPLDWERESSNMARIYRNAYLTISASASRDSYSGCFPKRDKDSYVSSPTSSLGYDTPREARGPNTYTLTYTNLERPGQMSLQLFEEWLPGSSAHAPQQTDIGTFGRRFDPIATEPLSSRGWTLQERLLSPRIVHYASDQMYFECETQLVSEDGFRFPDIFSSMKQLLATQRIPPQEHGLTKASGVSYIPGQYPVGPVPGRRWQGGWLSMIENYSRQKLTVDQDKLSAVAGLARVIAEETSDVYIAGLWARHLMEDLYWRVYAQEETFEEGDKGLKKRPVKGKVVGTVTRPKKYRAPSWSWASIDAPVKFIPLTYNHLVAHVEDFHTQPAGSDEYGRVSDGKLDLRGPIYEIKPHKPSGLWERHGIPVAVDFADGRGVSIGAVHLDMPDEPLQFPCYALFLDPANALIIRAKDFEPYRNEKGEEDPRKLVPKKIMTTADVNQVIREIPKGPQTIWLPGDRTSKDPAKRAPRSLVIPEAEYRALRGMAQGRSLLYKSINDAVRIGVGQFVKNYGGDKDEQEEPRQYDRERDGPLEDIALRVHSDESWGPVTRNDPIVWVTVF
ncbi:HET-domain-containing protein [Poronia punctata]|nr:HET-domain-containing protein [Poronia punctata]